MRSGHRARFGGLAGESERKMPMPRVLYKARHFEERAPRLERPDRRPGEGAPHVVPRRGESRRGGGGRGCPGASRGARRKQHRRGRDPAANIIGAVERTSQSAGSPFRDVRRRKRHQGDRTLSASFTDRFVRCRKRPGYVPVATATRSPSLTPDAGRSALPSPRSEARGPARGAATPSPPRRAR